MTKQQEMIKKLDELYSNDKSKNFVLHMVRAYLPLTKASKVFIKPEKLGKFKCAITGVKLISIDEIFQLMKGEEYQESLMDDLKYNAGLALEGKELPEDYVNPLVKLANGRMIGFQGEETSTYLCQEAIYALFEWVSIKILNGDGKINWTVNKMKNSGLPNLKKKGVLDKPKTSVPKPKRAVNTLGDFGVLGQLKDKLTEQENNEQG